MRFIVEYDLPNEDSEIEIERIKFNLNAALINSGIHGKVLKIQSENNKSKVVFS